MFDGLRKRFSPSLPPAAPVATGMHFALGSSEAELAADVLCEAPILTPLTREEAGQLVGYMNVLRFPAGSTLIREGDKDNTGYLLLMLDGEATAETLTVSRERPMTMTVLARGSVLGEMGLLDAAPRSLTCRADSDVLCAGLTRAALLQLTAQAPGVAAKLLILVAARLTQRLRGNTEKLKLYVQLVQTMQGEIDAQGAE